MRQRSEKYIIKGSNYAHWIGLYLSFHVSWVLGPFVHGRLQNLQTSEVTFAYVITPLIIICAIVGLPISSVGSFFIQYNLWALESSF